MSHSRTQASLALVVSPSSPPSLHLLRAQLWPVSRCRQTWTMPKPPEPSWDTHSHSWSGPAIRCHRYPMFWSDVLGSDSSQLWATVTVRPPLHCSPQSVRLVCYSELREVDKKHYNIQIQISDDPVRHIKIDILSKVHSHPDSFVCWYTQNSELLAGYFYVSLSRDYITCFIQSGLQRSEDNIYQHCPHLLNKFSATKNEYKH